MKGFVVSLTLAVGLFLALKITPVLVVVGFFGGLPLMVAYLPICFLPTRIGYPILTFLPLLVALGLHLRYREGERAMRDSPMTLFAAVWGLYANGVLGFLAAWQNAI